MDSMSQFIEMFKGDNQVPLGDICNIEKGATITRNDVLPGEVPVVAGGQEPSCYHNVANREAGAITVSASGAYAGYINFWNCPIFASDCNTIISKDDEKTDQTFVYFGLRAMQKQIYGLQKGGAQPHVYGKDLQKFMFPCPSYAKQIEFSKMAKQADKSKFGDFKSQFIEMVGDPRNNPKGWPTKRLSELAEYSIGLTYKPEQICDDGTIVLRSGNIQDGKISFSDIVRVNAPIKESLFVKEDDILMCSRNGSASLVGKVAMIPDINEPMTFGAFMTIIRSAEAKYLYLYFQSQDFRERVSEGKSSTMNQITQKMLDKVEVPFPDKDVRETLSAIASQADKSKSVIQKALVYLNDIQSDELRKIA